MAAISRIADYQPEKLLASSGMVDTFRARAKGKEGVVALKVLFLDRAGGDGGKPAAKRFLAAGRSLLESHIQGTAQVLDVSDELESAFVASELVAGVDLSALVALAGKRPARPRLDPVVAGLLCADAAEALAGAHRAKSPRHHLGLGPGNVVVTRAAKALVLDFGLTAALRTLATVSLDKWLFVAPEIVDVDVASLAPAAAVAADLYSLGALLHFLLSGRGPASAGTLADLRARKMQAYPDVPWAPKQLQSALRALTAPDPKERPDSAETVVGWLSSGISSSKERQFYVASALEALGIKPSIDPAEAPRPASIPSPRPVALAARPRRRGRLVTSLVLAAAFVTAAGVAAWFLTKKPTPRPLAEKARTSARVPNLHLSQVEVLTPRSLDAGLSAEPQPTDRVYVQGPKQKLPRVAEHLYLATNPDQADVWVDGVLKGKTPADLATGPGGHRVVAFKPGYRMVRAVYDTTEGEYVRKDLQRAVPPTVGDAWLDIDCREAGKFPIFVDDEETGLACPANRVPVSAGRHTIGIFVPAKRTVVTVEVTAAAGPKSTRVSFKD